MGGTVPTVQFLRRGIFEIRKLQYHSAEYANPPNNSVHRHARVRDMPPGRDSLCQRDARFA
jgi:hypothetical protein